MRVGPQLSVYDKETVMKDNLIGSYQLDCLSVYFRVRFFQGFHP
jgi:hypothetical protein